MIHRNGSAAMVGRVLAAFTGLILLAGCGGGSGNSTTTTTTTPGASLSASSLTFPSQSVGTPSSVQSITLNSTGTAALALSGITITGTNSTDFTQSNTCGASVNSGAGCTINVTFTPGAAGARTATLTVTDNASPSTQTVALSGTGAASTVSLSGSSLTYTIQTMVGTPTTAQTITLNNAGTAALTIASIVTTGDFSQTDNCGASVGVGGSCTINVTFTPTAAGTRTGTLTITDNSNGVAGTTQTVALTGSGFSSNTAAVNVNFGPNGYIGPVTATSGSYYNGIFTTVTVCAPGTSNCTTIPNVLVDTGSVGLRVLSNQLGSVTLPSITDSSSNILYSCTQYGDGSYNWGPMQMATVQLAGETASQIPGGTANSGIPIQVITLNGTAPTQVQYGNGVITTPCVASGGPSDNSVQTLEANGILGVGNYAQDCGTFCVTSAASNPNYILCTPTGSACEITPVPLSVQAWNPISAFASADTNGSLLQLQAIPAIGTTTVAGSLVFGIGTQTCTGAPSGCTPNTLGSAHVYALDTNGNFPTTVLNTITYNVNNDASYGAFLDSGSNAYFISDAATLGISDCTVSGTDIYYYCPASTLNPVISLTDNNGVSTGALGVSFANALTLFANNPTFAAFSNLGGDSGAGPTSDYFDFGLPFFYGRTVYTGIMGTNAPNGTSVPDGYWAF